MSDTVHNWDIDVLKQMMSEIQKLSDILKENKDLLVSEGFELLQDWQGKAGQKMFLVTVTDAGKLENLIEKYSQLAEQLDNIITKCYAPCEDEIKAKVSQLIY